MREQGHGVGSSCEMAPASVSIMAKGEAIIFCQNMSRSTVEPGYISGYNGEVAAL